jgi:hypothetical protein
MSAMQCRRYAPICDFFSRMRVAWQFSGKFDIATELVLRVRRFSLCRNMERDMLVFP